MFAWLYGIFLKLVYLVVNVWIVMVVVETLAGKRKRD